MKRIHDWDKLDPLLFDREWKLTAIAREHGISYRSVTNRKYQVRDRFERRLKRKLTFDEVGKLLAKQAQRAQIQKKVPKQKKERKQNGSRS